MKTTSNGFSLIELTLCMAILGSLVLVAMQIQSTLYRSKMVQYAADYIMQVTQELRRFATLQGRFPEDFDELTNLPDKTPWNITFQFQTQSEKLRVTTQLPSSAVAEKVVRLFGQGSVSGATLAFEVQKPVTEFVWDFALYRYPVEGRPELNRMETNLDMNNFALLNVGLLESSSLQVEELSAERLDIEAHYTESLRVQHTATLNQVNVGDITGQTLTVSNMTSDYAEIQELLVQDLSTDLLDVEKLTTIHLVADDIIADRLEVQRIEADEMIARDFITQQGSFSDFLQRLNTLEVLWNACVVEGGCQ